MNLTDCTKFANENQVCFVATAYAGQPHVRAFAMWYADETGFYFHGGATKAVFTQLRANPKVELCFWSPAPPPSPGTMMRVTGEVEFLDDSVLKARLLEERPFLKAMGISGPDDLRLAVFRVPHGEAQFWTMENNMRESEIERIKF